MDAGTVIVIWLLCAFTSAAIMNGKTNDNGKVVLYLVLGLVIGIFGVLLALAAPNEKQAAVKGTVPVLPQRQCPYCRELIIADAIKCRHCGEHFDRELARR